MNRNTSRESCAKTPRTYPTLFSRSLVIVFWAALVGISVLRTPAQDRREGSASVKVTATVDMTIEELRLNYRAELIDLEYNPSQERLDSLMREVGERVEAFFRDFSNTSSKERVRMQRLTNNRIEVDSRTQEFEYLILPHSGNKGVSFEEVRTDTKGRPVNPTKTAGFMISSGYAGLCLYFHPGHHFGSRFRYLGQNTSEPRAHVIAFAQKPEVGDYLAGISGTNPWESASLLVQGIVWIDPRSFQIVRMRTELLIPPSQSGLIEQSTDIHFSEVRFAAGRLPLVLPREVTVFWRFAGQSYRNRHRYSDYKVFTVESYDKISPPETKPPP